MSSGLCRWAFALLAIVPGTLWAVPITVDQLDLSEDQKVALLRQLQAPGIAKLLSSPAIAFGSPVGFGQVLGEASVGLAGQILPPDNQDSLDGSMGASVGLGSSRVVGVELGVNVISLTEGFGDSGSFSAKMHKLLNNTSAISVGVESFGAWGLAKQRDPSVFAAITHVVNVSGLNMPLAMNIGIGNGRFRDDLQNTENDNVGVFGGFALIVDPRLSLIADYTGVGLSLGVSVVPVATLPFTATLGFSNVTEQENGSAEFAGAIGYRFVF
ncbi:MAG: hypothetical protein V4688_06095 [Pseudomonadota bacterium]